MWKFLYQMASPRLFYRWTQSFLPWLGGLALLLLVTGFVWGLAFAPPDYQQGDAFRIIYVHVPAAFLSMSLYALMAFCSVLLIVWRIKLAGLMIMALAEVGAWMAFLALVTGSIWGKPMWGTWWVWDARLTSELVLLLLYAAILATGAAFRHRLDGDRVVAILALVGAIDLPIIHYSVYWWNTLHQGATLSLLSKPKIDASMLYPLLISLCGFLCYSAWLVFHKAGNTLLLREKKQRWVQELAQRG
ncbi:heme ABC transporter permease CcmC [Legionella sp. CNM-4043-24]|uniref:heme ABC transporter permease CcmC n=1 Tax=Legionella sp. CNM-4043-24 TaxID=3421646 RepID=UPI00403B128C